MNQINNIQGSINRIKMHSQELKDNISTLKGEDVSTSYYLINLKRLSLQALDLFSAMEKQVSFLHNQKRISVLRENIRKRRVIHGLSME